MTAPADGLRQPSQWIERRPIIRNGKPTNRYRWRVRTVDVLGRTTSRTFPTKREAKEWLMLAAAKARAIEEGRT